MLHGAKRRAFGTTDGQVSCTYTALWNAFKRIVADFSEEDKNKLFYENAKRVYRLSVQT